MLPSRVDPFRPIISRGRVSSQAAKWTPKFGGELKEGTSHLATHYFTGGVEMRESKGVCKLFFFDVTLVQRKQAGEEESDSEDEDDDMMFGEKKEASVVPLPILRLYLCKKHPKARMSDVHVSKHVKPLPLTSDPEDGTFGKEEHTLGNFQESLRDIDHPLQYQGVVIVKLPEDAPYSDESVVFSYCTFHNMKFNITASMNFLGTAHETEVMNNMLRHRREHKAQDEDRIKPMKQYLALAHQAWGQLGYDEEESIDLDEFAAVLPVLDVHMLEPRMRRIFHTVQNREEEINQDDFVDALMIEDIVMDEKELFVWQAYDAFDFEGEGIDEQGFNAAFDLLERPTSDPEARAKLWATGAKDKPLMSWAAFQRLYVASTNYKTEFRARNLEISAADKPRERLGALLEGEHQAYEKQFEDIRSRIKTLKSAIRLRQDEARRKRKEERAVAAREAKKFDILRKKEADIKLMKEQAQRAKHREEARILKNQLDIQRAANLQRQVDETKQDVQDRVKQQRDEVRRLGLDRLVMQNQRLRYIPPEMYKGQEAQDRLSYTVILDLSFNRLRCLPAANAGNPFCYWMANLRMLKLSNNRLERLPDDIKFVNNLEILEVDSNRLVELPEEIGALANLKHLIASQNEIREIPESIGACSKLAYVSLHSNHIREIPESMCHVLALQYVDLSFNGLTDIHEDFSHLAQLTHCDLSANSISQLPHGFSNLESLTYLNLNSNNVALLPASFAQVTNLQVLELNNNDILYLPSSVGDFKDAWKIELSNNSISTVDGAIGNCLALQTLDLRRNDITELPGEIGMLSVLKDLNLEDNRIVTLPEEFGALTSLRRVTLRNNNLQGALSNALGLLPLLQELDISHNFVRELPGTIGGLQSLSRLIANHNNASELPMQIQDCHEMLELDMAANRFTTFPLVINNMTRLKTFDLSGNKIKRLPRGIMGCTRLEELNLERNLLECLPLEFTEAMRFVRDIRLAYNPWTALPPKWNDIWNTHVAVAQPHGYSPEEALLFLEDIKMFFPVCSDTWSKVGALHMTGRLQWNDFHRDVREILGVRWSPDYSEQIKWFYFRARQTGYFPSFHEENEEELRRNRDLEEFVARRSEGLLEKVKQEQRDLEEFKHHAYHDDLRRRTARAEERLLLRHKHPVASHRKMGLQEVYMETRRRAFKQERKRVAMLQRREAQEQNERARMFHLVQAARGDHGERKRLPTVSYLAASVAGNSTADSYSAMVDESAGFDSWLGQRRAAGKSSRAATAAAAQPTSEEVNEIRRMENPTRKGTPPQAPPQFHRRGSDYARHAEFHTQSEIKSSTRRVFDNTPLHTQQQEDRSTGAWRRQSDIPRSAILAAQAAEANPNLRTQTAPSSDSTKGRPAPRASQHEI